MVNPLIFVILIRRNWFCWRTSHSASRKKTSWIKGFYPITISPNIHSTPRFALYATLKPNYFTLHTLFCSLTTKVKWKLEPASDDQADHSCQSGSHQKVSPQVRTRINKVHGQTQARAELKWALQQHRSRKGWSSRPEFIWIPRPRGRVWEWRVFKGN